VLALTWSLEGQIDRVLRSKLKVVSVLTVVAVCSVVTALLVVNKSRANHQSEEIANQSGASEFLSPLDDSSGEVGANLPLFRRLNQDYIRGSQPARGGVKTLARLGVKTIIDLRSRYDYTQEPAVSAELLGLRYYWLPMSVWDPPSDEIAQRFISIVTDKPNLPVFVFCADGVNRTGEMSAIYRLVNDNWSVDQALKEIDELGFNAYYWSLRNFVWTYARKFRPSALPKSARRLSAFGAVAH
jgi:protein tyrosine phosphatase (PTP) superfamily phosphohydrolase (DUF442 family)